MKKSMFFAFAVAAVLSSCSSEEAFNPIQQEEGLQEIKIGMSSAHVQTRGTGTVGSTDELTNEWAGQEINVFMLKKGTLDKTMFSLKNNDEVEVFFDTPFLAPAEGASDLATTKDGSIKYYPTEGESDFWGYHLDDAKAGAPAVEENTLTVPFRLNGTQDIMVAKTVADDDPALRLYSAYSARRGYQPELKFEHVLSRLTFEIKAGGNTESAKATCGIGTEDGVFVESVMVKSKTTGKLVVAYTPAVKEQYASVASQIAFEDTKEELFLMQRNGGANDLLAPFDRVRPQWNAESNASDFTQIGEAILVAPDSEYDIVVNMSQKVDGFDEPVIFSHPTTIKLTDKTFEAGKSYKVQVTIYGLEKINITATLAPWGTGDDITVDPDIYDGI